MAEVIKRVWKSGPRKVRKVAWGYTLQVDGKQERRVSSAWTEDDAERELAARILGVETSKPPDAGGAPTFQQAAERFLAVKESERKLSIRDDRMHLARLRAVFGDETPLAAISASRISEYKVARAGQRPKRGAEGTTIAPATLNRELATLRHLLRLAVEEWGWLDKAPVVRLVREPQGRLRYLTEDEIARLLDATARSQNPYLWTIVALALNSGMRRGEILGLSWERVDFARGALLLERTKSGRRREVPMNTAADAALNALAGDKVEGHVFGKKGGAAWGSIRTAWDNACREAKLEDFHFHDLRHTFASHFIMRGGSLAALREILGHADLKMTMRYAHLSPAHRRADVDKLDGLTPSKPREFSTRSAHEVESEESRVASA